RSVTLRVRRLSGRASLRQLPDFAVPPNSLSPTANGSAGDRAQDNWSPAANGPDASLLSPSDNAQDSSQAPNRHPADQVQVDIHPADRGIAGSRRSAGLEPDRDFAGIGLADSADTGSANPLLAG